MIPPLAAFLVAAAAPLPAQEEKAKQTDPAMEEFDALQKEFRLKVRDAALKEKADEARAEAAKAFLSKFQEFADKHAETDAGLRAVASILGIQMRAGDDAAYQATFESALKAYGDKDGFATVVRGVHGDDAEKTLQRVLETSKNPKVKAAAKLALGDLYWDEGKAKGEELAKARAAFEEVVAKYPDTDAAKEAKGNLNDLLHLQVGMKAPDVSFTDLKGNAHKLSEFRGKVLLLNFWAPW